MYKGQCFINNVFKEKLAHCNFEKNKTLVPESDNYSSQ